MADERKNKARPERGLRHIALKTRDLHSCERFYVDILGLEVAYTHRGMLFLETPGGGDLLNFVVTRKRLDAAAGGLDHFGLHVPAQEWRSLLARLGRVRVPIEGRRGRSAIYVKDPNGYTVELYRD